MFSILLKAFFRENVKYWKLLKYKRYFPILRARILVYDLVGHNPELIRLQMDNITIYTIQNVHHPEWVRSQMYTICNGRNPEWIRSGKDTIPNLHNLKYTQSRRENGHFHLHSY